MTSTAELIEVLRAQLDVWREEIADLRRQTLTGRATLSEIHLQQIAAICDAAEQP